MRDLGHHAGSAAFGMSGAAADGLQMQCLCSIQLVYSMVEEGVWCWMTRETSLWRCDLTRSLVPAPPSQPKPASNSANSRFWRRTAVVVVVERLWEIWCVQLPPALSSRPWPRMNIMGTLGWGGSGGSGGSGSSSLSPRTLVTC